MYIIELMDKTNFSLRKKYLSQYFTPTDIANVLASQLQNAPNELLELGAGRGSLISAVLDRYPNSRATMVELDSMLLSDLKKFGKQHSVHHANVLTGLDEVPLLKSYSAVVGNPPFSELAVAENQQGLLRSQFPQSVRGGLIRQDLVFLYESWKRVKPGGELVMLLAAPILNDPAFKSVRQWILSDAKSVKVIELPENSFVGAEVGTYLLAIKHRGRGACAKAVQIDRFNGDGKFQGENEVSIKDAIERMDYRFYTLKALAGLQWNSSEVLSSLSPQIVRGSRSHAQFVREETPHVHTTDFLYATERMRLACYTPADIHNAEAGDILLPRVGSRCLIREALVLSGSLPISDTVFRIRVRKKDRHRLLYSLSNESGRLWRDAHARGSCARHITIRDLMSLPITH